jgi:uncharacterized membrane protein
MILASPLVWLKPVYLLGLSAVLFVGTEWLVPGMAQWNEPVNTIKRLLLLPGGGLELWVNYPVLPWLELVLFGMAFGGWLAKNPQGVFQRALKLGLLFLALFGIIRILDGFGNIRPRTGDGWIEFLNVVKYPPSMTFTLLTTGVNLILLWVFTQTGEKARRLLQPLVVYGRTPLFFYVLHLFLYAVLGHVFTPHGASLGRMYIFWILGLLILYPACLWYGRLKHCQPPGSVLRFL